MHKKISVGMLLASVILAVALTVSVTMVIAIRYFNSTVSDVTQRQAMFEYVTDVDKIVRYHYNGTIDEEKLRRALGKGYIDGIDDPYAAYLSSDEYKEALDTRKGKETGFGLELALSDNGRMIVSRVHPNSTADKAGIEKGDVLTAVNGSEVSASDFSSVNRTLSDAPKVILSVRRENTPHAFEISTSTYDFVSVEGRMTGSDIGLIRLYSVNDRTPDQFKTVYESLQKQGAVKFIFDVRDNAGGSPEAIEKILSFLVPEGPYAQQTDNTGKTTYLTSGNARAMTSPSVTLVNSRTAGEAELFAGVLQELGKTTVVGELTAGKGMIQELYTVNNDGAAVRLSVAERRLIKAGSIEDKGITPDEEVKLREQLALVEEPDDTPLQAAVRRLTSGGTTTQPAGTTIGTTSPKTEPSKTGSPSAVTTRATTRKAS